jgi:hypothetical protein
MLGSLRRSMVQPRRKPIRCQRCYMVASSNSSSLLPLFLTSLLPCYRRCQATTHRHWEEAGSPAAGRPPPTSTP